METISSKKVLITGASGFLGTHLCDRLCRNGAEVYAISRQIRTSEHPNLHWWQSNLEDLEAVEKLLTKIQPDIIFHLSGNVTGAAGSELVLSTYHSLLTSTVNILTVASNIGCDRLVLIGSLEEPDSSNHQIVPASPYAAAKWASSAYGRMFHQLYQTPVVIARTFMTYGPGQPTHKIIPSVILSLLQNQPPKLASGKREVDWIYIDDVITGLIATAKMPNIEGSTFDLGSGILIPIRQVVEKITDLLGAPVQPLFGVLPDRPVEKVTIANTSITQTQLNWQPVTTLEKGLLQTIDWYKNQLLKTTSSSKELPTFYRDSSALLTK
jgi:UDP-glucose 4-epimerase